MTHGEANDTNPAASAKPAATMNGPSTTVEVGPATPTAAAMRCHQLAVTTRPVSALC